MNHFEHCLSTLEVLYKLVVDHCRLHNNILFCCSLGLWALGQAGAEKRRQVGTRSPSSLFRGWCTNFDEQCSANVHVRGTSLPWHPRWVSSVSLFIVMVITVIYLHGPEIFGGLLTPWELACNLGSLSFGMHRSYHCVTHEKLSTGHCCTLWSLRVNDLKGGMGSMWKWQA